MKLVTFDEGRVGRLAGEEVVELDVPSTRAYFERGGLEGGVAGGEVDNQARLVLELYRHQTSRFTLPFTRSAV